MPGKKRRFKPSGGGGKRGSKYNWHVEDAKSPDGAVHGYYFTTKTEAQEYADELEQDEHAI